MKTAEEIRKFTKELYAANCNDYFFSNVDEAFHKGIEIGVEYTSQFNPTKEITDKDMDEEISPRVAKLILKIRDSYIEQDFEDVWHFLYQIASPNFDKFQAWGEIERIAMHNNEIKPAKDWGNRPDPKDVNPYDSKAYKRTKR